MEWSEQDVRRALVQRREAPSSLEVLLQLHATGWTGKLVVFRQHCRGVIWLVDGQVAHAALHRAGNTFPEAVGEQAAISICTWSAVEWELQQVKAWERPPRIINRPLAWLVIAAARWLASASGAALPAATRQLARLLALIQPVAEIPHQVSLSSAEWALLCALFELEPQELLAMHSGASLRDQLAILSHLAAAGLLEIRAGGSERQLARA